MKNGIKTMRYDYTIIIGLVRAYYSNLDSSWLIINGLKCANTFSEHNIKSIEYVDKSKPHKNEPYSYISYDIGIHTDYISMVDYIEAKRASLLDKILS